MSLKRICAAVALAAMFASCTHVGTKVGNVSKGGFTTVVVDAGHGGKDRGGTSGRRSVPFQREKDLTLDTAKRVRELLRRSGFRVVMMCKENKKKRAITLVKEVRAIRTITETGRTRGARRRPRLDTWV